MTVGTSVLKPSAPQSLNAAPRRREGVFTWRDYSAEKQEYIRTHPEATPAEIQQFSQQLVFEMGL